MLPLAPSDAECKVKLSNGVRVLLDPLPHARSAAIGFWVDAGSLYEPAPLSGACHFIEHMLFKGTSKRSAFEIARAIEVTGGAINAFTDKEHTCFYARVLDADVPLAIDILADMLLASRFDASEIARERSVVVSEIKMYEDAPDELVHDLHASAFWPGHALGRPITGTAGTVRRFSRAVITSFFARAYAPDRLVVAVSGAFDRARVLDQLEALLGGVSSRSDLDVPGPLAPSPKATVRARDVEQVQLVMSVPGLSGLAPERYDLAVLTALLGGGMSSRLFQEVREKRGLAYAIGSFEQSFKLGGMVGVEVGTSPRQLDEVVAVTLGEIEALCAGGPAEAELLDTKQQLTGGIRLSLESPRARMNHLAQNELYFGRQLPVEETIAGIEAVSPESVAALSRQLFARGRWAMTVVGPQKRLGARTLARIGA